MSNTLDSDSDYVTLPSTYQGYVPVPPKRVDSAEPRFRPPPPPYPSQPPPKPPTSTSDYQSEASNLLSELSLRDPPPYPESTSSSIPAPVYPSEEATARFITTRPPNILTAHTSVVGSSPSYSTPSAVPPIPPKIPRTPQVVGDFFGWCWCLWVLKCLYCRALRRKLMFCCLARFCNHRHRHVQDNPHHHHQLELLRCIRVSCRGRKLSSTNSRCIVMLILWCSL